MSLDLAVTLAAIFAALAVGTLMVVLERRGPSPDRRIPVPTTPILFLSLLVLVVALAHLMTVISGSPHMGRLG